MSSENGKMGYRELLSDDKSLQTFLSALSKFDSKFCDRMADGEEFTIRLEVRGKSGKLEYCRVYDDELMRLDWKDRGLDRKLRVGNSARKG